MMVYEEDFTQMNNPLSKEHIYSEIRDVPIGLLSYNLVSLITQKSMIAASYLGEGELSSPYLNISDLNRDARNSLNAVSHLPSYFEQKGLSSKNSTLGDYVKSFPRKESYEFVQEVADIARWAQVNLGVSLDDILSESDFQLEQAA